MQHEKYDEMLCDREETGAACHEVKSGRDNLHRKICNLHYFKKEFVCAQFVFCFLTDEGYLALKFAPIVPIQ